VPLAALMQTRTDLTGMELRRIPGTVKDLVVAPRSANDYGKAAANGPFRRGPTLMAGNPSRKSQSSGSVSPLKQRRVLNPAAHTQTLAPRPVRTGRRRHAGCSRRNRRQMPREAPRTLAGCFARAAQAEYHNQHHGSAAATPIQGKTPDGAQSSASQQKRSGDPDSTAGLCPRRSGFLCSGARLNGRGRCGCRRCRPSRIEELTEKEDPALLEPGPKKWACRPKKLDTPGAGSRRTTSAGPGNVRRNFEKFRAPRLRPLGSARTSSTPGDRLIDASGAPAPAGSSPLRPASVHHGVENLGGRGFEVYLSFPHFFFFFFVFECSPNGVGRRPGLFIIDPPGDESAALLHGAVGGGEPAALRSGRRIFSASCLGRPARAQPANIETLRKKIRDPSGYQVRHTATGVDTVRRVQQAFFGIGASPQCGTGCGKWCRGLSHSAHCENECISVRPAWWLPDRRPTARLHAPLNLNCREGPIWVDVNDSRGTSTMPNVVRNPAYTEPPGRGPLRPS